MGDKKWGDELLMTSPANIRDRRFDDTAFLHSIMKIKKLMIGRSSWIRPVCLAGVRTLDEVMVHKQINFHNVLQSLSDFRTNRSTQRASRRRLHIWTRMTGAVMTVSDCGSAYDLNTVGTGIWRSATRWPGINWHNPITVWTLNFSFPKIIISHTLTSKFKEFTVRIESWSLKSYPKKAQVVKPFPYISRPSFSVMVWSGCPILLNLAKRLIVNWNGGSWIAK